MTYKPIFDGVHWHAAYALPGNAGYATVTECPSERTATDACIALERASRRVHKELATDSLLRGVRVGGHHG